MYFIINNMYFINNKFYLKQLLWLLEEEKKFYINYYNYNNFNSFYANKDYANKDYANKDYINNVYKITLLLNKNYKNKIKL